MSPKAIPDRWIPYSSVGSVIEGTRLICFKVPLRKSVIEAGRNNGLHIAEIWDIDTLVKRVPKLRYVIDLTNTDRYYDPRVLEAAGVEHVKINMPGRVIPPEATVKIFCDTVERFLGRSDDGLVGVHCTHGVNRTGYMVCRYLRDRLNMPPMAAIEIFEAARGYKIERDNYLADIHGNEPPPPDFGRDTILQPTGSPFGYENGSRYGRHTYERPSMYGSSGIYRRENIRSRSRERSPVWEGRRRARSPVREGRRQETSRVDRRSRDAEHRGNSHRRRFRKHSNTSDDSTCSDYDFRYDY